MRIAYYFFLITFLVACGAPDSEQQPPCDWLLGNWERINDAEGQKTYEFWQKGEGGNYTGMGCTLVGTDTIFKEHLSVLKSNNRWVLEVRGVNEQPTLFEMIHVTDSSWIVENKNNEFPKRIQYRISDRNLEAVISDEENSILFQFQKMKPL